MTDKDQQPMNARKVRRFCEPLANHILVGGLDNHVSATWPTQDYKVCVLLFSLVAIYINVVSPFICNIEVRLN